MSWDAKKNGKHRYYYRSERQPGCPYPVKVYVGKGAAAQEAARQLEERRLAQQARRQAEREALLTEQICVLAAEEALRALQNLVDFFVCKALHEAGYYRRRGEWRRQHDKDGHHEQEG
jgi:hypothetical protein